MSDELPKITFKKESQKDYKKDKIEIDVTAESVEKAFKKFEEIYEKTADEDGV